MARVEGLGEVKKALNRLSDKFPPGTTTVVVGCTQRYALFVHENLQARHPVGQAKFLETPARQQAGTLAEIIRNAATKGAGVIMGLKLAGLHLMKLAQFLTPVDTSALKSSYFVVLEEDLDAKSEEMFAKSEEIRKTRPSRWDRMRGKGRRR